MMNKVLRFAIFAALVFAFWYGKSITDQDLSIHVRELFQGDISIRNDGDIFYAYSENNTLLGWAAAGTAAGYGGPLTIITGVDTSGTFIGASIVEHKETPIFFRMVKPNNYINELKSLHINDVNFNYSEVVGVTGATRSADAISNSIRNSLTRIAGQNLNIEIPEVERQFRFGILEVTIIILFIVGILHQRTDRRFREKIRWISQITGLIVIGFWENSPISISKISSFLSGYFPDYYSNLHWYLLLLGFILTIFIYNKSIYCSHLCPFGTVQRCVGVIGGGRLSLPSWAIRMMIIIRNTVVFLAVFFALLTANPGNISYEPFAAVFALKGSTLQWILLLIVLTVSLVIRNPWCHFFCPMRTCEKVIQVLRKPFKKMLGANNSNG
ncbi:MAG: FMN-binding protein [bacterium]|nr:FMN-binding protein [bacterium]